MEAPQTTKTPRNKDEKIRVNWNPSESAVKYLYQKENSQHVGTVETVKKTVPLTDKVNKKHHRPIKFRTPVDVLQILLCENKTEAEKILDQAHKVAIVFHDQESLITEGDCECFYGQFPGNTV